MDPNYAHGPLEERPCTDVFCLIIFLLFLGAVGYVAYLGFSTGNPSLLASPFDEDANHCKYD